MKATLLFLLTLLTLTTTTGAQSRRMTIGTYNLRYNNADDAKAGNSWQQRAPVIANLIRFNDFDIFGTQEGLIGMLRDLDNLLPGYARIGIGRDDGKDAGEHSAIFYKTDRYQLLDHGDFWLSAITDKPNKGWDAVLPRICSWGKFKEKSTGFVFYCYNLHMDHVGVTARNESAKLVLSKIRQQPASIPAILTGDFNIDQYNEGYKLVNTSGTLRDAIDEAPIKWTPGPSFNGWNLNRCTDSRIDHIFLTKAFTALRYGILNNTYYTCPNPTTDTSKANTQRLPSDHYPVMTVVKY